MCGPLPSNHIRRRACQALSHSHPKTTDLPISYNIAPSQKVLTIPETRARSLDTLQWGLIPYWAKDPKVAYRTINARAETVDKAPSYRQAFLKRRCLIPADGFYEWRKTLKPKLPFAIAMKDGRPFTFAGLWEGWKDPESGIKIYRPSESSNRLW
jgi:putative SOS response-associated peptidase YedK